MIVLDASAVVVVLLEATPRAKRIRQRIESPGVSLHAPHVLDLEVLHTLRRQVFRSALTQERASLAITRLRETRLTRYPHASLTERIWELKDNVTSYDAAYITLAETLEAPLITTDGRLARSSGHRARVELFE